MGIEDIVNSLGEKIMNINLKQAQAMLTGNLELFIIALLNVAIVDFLLVLANVRSKTVRYLVGFSIFLATMLKMNIALFLFNLIGLPLMVAVAFFGTIVKLTMLSKTAVKKIAKKTAKRR